MDGWRAQVAVDRETVTVRSRRGRLLELPELAPLLDLGLAFVVDAEIVAGDGSMDSFYGVAPALARRTRTQPVTLAVFDLLWLDRSETIGLPLRHRRSLLEQLDLPAPATVVPAWAGTDAPPLLEACERLGVEGLVLKDTSSKYEPGKRSTAWRKVKVSAWREVHAEKRRPR